MIIRYLDPWGKGSLGFRIWGFGSGFLTGSRRALSV